jgi:UDP-N-acetylmuramoyl-tripeptide--D-alanyl-D-alanine ligase
VAVLNADSPHAAIWARSSPAPVLRYGLDAPADVRGFWTPGDHGGRLRIEGPFGSGEVHLALHGRHNASNALAAAAAAHALGLPLAAVLAGLEGAEPLPGRLQAREHGGLAILDDTYNANPASLEAALAVLAEGSGRRWLVLGDMQELGAAGGEWHRRAGELARRFGVDRLLAVGGLAAEAAAAFGAGGQEVADGDAAAAVLEREAAAGDRVLLKGSRGMRLDRLAARLTGAA